MNKNSEIVKNLPNIITGFLIRDAYKTVYPGNASAHIPDLTIYSNKGKVPESFAGEMIQWIQNHDTKKESKPDMGMFIATIEHKPEVMTVSLRVDTTVQNSMREIELRVEIV